MAAVLESQQRSRPYSVPVSRGSWAAASFGRGGVPVWSRPDARRRKGRGADHAGDQHRADILLLAIPRKSPKRVDSRMLGALIGVLIATIACATLFRPPRSRQDDPRCEVARRPAIARGHLRRKGRPAVPGHGAPEDRVVACGSRGVRIRPRLRWSHPASTGESADTGKLLSDHLGLAMRAGSPS